jgi:predicted DCC family thiol-disulfide oxidoreductase YuxK
MNSELTEMTDIKEQSKFTLPGTLEAAGLGPRLFRGWILYDGECQSCTASARSLDRICRHRGFLFLPLQTEWVMQRLGLEPGAPLKEMHVITSDGRDIAGGDAAIFLARQIWWAWPIVAFAQLPGAHRLVDRGYRWIAARRRCGHIACDLKKRRLSSRRMKQPAVWRPPLLEVWPGWILLIDLPITVLPLRHHLAAWQFMWLTAAAIFFGCKWLTAWHAQKPNAHLKLASTLGYFFAWPGMDAEKFLSPNHGGSQLDGLKRSSLSLIQTCGWPAIGKILLGTILLFGVARFAIEPLLTGWIGMIGFILILHFGLFQLLAIAWRKAGIDVEPIMNAPLPSKTVSEFWGRRWNSAFNQLALEFVSRPITRRLGRRSSCDAARRSPRISTLHFGAAIATLTAFVVSGLIHELVISLPAGAGYGLPTAYFLLQGIGILLERAFPLIRGRTFTILITGAPAFWLFHPPFVHNVILPFMRAIAAL